MLLLHNYMLLKVKYFAADKVKSLICRVFIEAHCVKSVRIRSYSDPYFPTFGLNTERYGVSLRIQSKYGKIRTRITPNTDTFYAVAEMILFCMYVEFCII